MTGKEEYLLLTKYESVCYELLRPAQIRDLRDKCPIAYISVGSLEWHGMQNPLGTDGLKAHAICCKAALRHGGIVLPPFYQGLFGVLGVENWGPKDWAGYTLSFNQRDMFEAAMLGIATAMVFGGWKVIVGVTGHDVREQRDLLGKAIAGATEGQDAAGFALMEGELHQGNDDIPYTMDHGAAWETSCMMYAYPDKVDLNALRHRPLSSDELLDMWGPEGIGGPNPLKHASAELGAAIIEKMADLIGAKALAALANLRARSA